MARSSRGSLYQQLLADPGNGPLAQLPDGYGAKTFVTRLISVVSGTTNPLGNMYLLFRPWNLGPSADIGAGTRAHGKMMGPVVYQDVRATMAAADANWYANQVYGFQGYNATTNGTVEKIRFLCAELDAEYIGPHGDGQVGAVYVNNTLTGMRVSSNYVESGLRYTVPLAGTDPVETNTGCYPQDFRDDGVNGTANAYYAPVSLQAMPSTKVVPMGTCFKVRMYPKSVVGDGFFNKPAEGASDLLSTGGITVHTYGSVPEAIAESLPNCVVNITGGGNAVTLYRFTLRSVFEMTPSYSFTNFIPGTLPPNEPRVLEQSRTAMERLSEIGTEVWSYTQPYLSELASLGVGYASNMALSKIRRRLG